MAGTAHRTQCPPDGLSTSPCDPKAVSGCGLFNSWHLVRMLGMSQYRPFGPKLPPTQLVWYGWLRNGYTLRLLWRRRHDNGHPHLATFIRITRIAALHATQLEFRVTRSHTFKKFICTSCSKQVSLSHRLYSCCHYYIGSFLSATSTSSIIILYYTFIAQSGWDWRGNKEINKGGEIGSLIRVFFHYYDFFFIAVSFSDYILYRDWTVGFKYLFLLRMYSGTFMEGMKMWGMGIGMIDHSYYDLRKTSKNGYCSGG